VDLFVDGVKTDDFAGKIEPQHLLLTILVDDVALETPRPDRRDRLELVARPENMFAGLNGPGLVDDMLELFDTGGIETAWKAKITQRALTARNLNSFRKIRFLLYVRAHVSPNPVPLVEVSRGL
jgi:hypothetical protein